MIPGLHRLLWTRFTWRHVLLAPGSSLLLAAILALGVAVYLSIRLANRAAVSGFQNFTDLITAESDGLVTAPAGSLPESVLRELRSAFGPMPVHLVPVLETTAARPPAPGVARTIGDRETFQILGVDLIGVQNLPAARNADRSWFAQEASEGTAAAGADPEAFWRRFRDPRGVFIPEALAHRDGIGPGGSLRLILNETVVELRVTGILPADPGRPAAPETLLVMDLPALQELTGRTGRLDRVEFVLPEGPDRAARWELLRKDLERLGEGRWTVGTPADRRDSAAMMTRAFRLNLTVLSLLSLPARMIATSVSLDARSSLAVGEVPIPTLRLALPTVMARVPATLIPTSAELLITATCPTDRYVGNPGDEMITAFPTTCSPATGRDVFMPTRPAL